MTAGGTFDRRRGGAAVAWFGLAVLGQLAAFQMIEAGPRPGYQHYLPLDVILATRRLALAVVLGQAIAVGFGLARWWRTAGTAALPRARIAVVLLLGIATAATVSPQPVRYLSELAWAGALQLLSLATIMLMARAVPSPLVRAAAARIATWFGPDPDAESTSGARISARTFMLAAGGLALAIAAVLAVVVYERHPHVPDEVVYLLQARYFAEGLLTMELPPVQAAFVVDLMSYEAAGWFAPVPPGWSAVLALGVLAGVPWLVNPILAGVNVVLTCLLVRQLYSERMGRIAAALLAVSPWFLFLGMSWMTHQWTLTCGLVAALAVDRARRTAHFRWGLLAGAGVGITSLIRPLDGVIIGGLIALWAIGVGGRRLRTRALAGLAIGTFALGALGLAYNAMLTGDPLTFPINTYVESNYPENANAYGFGPDRGMGWPTDPNPGHDAIDGLINANLNTFAINTELFGWATGSLLLIAWLLTGGRLNRSDLVMLAVILAVCGAYFFYYFAGGPDFGARYWFLIIVPLVALSARGFQDIERRVGPRAWLAAGALVLLALTAYVPWRAADKYHHYRGMRADIRALAADHRFGPALILVEGRRFPDFASAAVFNPIDLSADAPIYAWDRSPEVRAAVLRAWPDRPVWRVAGPSVTGDGYRVVQGPVSAAEIRDPSAR